MIETQQSVAAQCEARFNREGARAPRGTCNPYKPGSAAATWWQRGHDAAANIPTTRGPRLYLAGHNHKRGHAVALELVDAPPLRYLVNLRKARTLVRRFNRAAEARETGGAK